MLRVEDWKSTHDLQQDVKLIYGPEAQNSTRQKGHMVDVKNVVGYFINNKNTKPKNCNSVSDDVKRRMAGLINQVKRPTERCVSDM